jgi:two-component system response regulator RegX3
MRWRRAKSLPVSETARKQRILVVDDEPSFVDALAISLEAEGYEVITAVDGFEALERFRAVRPDLVLLDLMLPRISGVDVCRDIRGTSNVPIIMVTAKSSEVDVVVGLEVGADDYITKPYRIRELLARIRATLRRVEESKQSGSSGLLELGGVTLDRERHEVSVDGEPVTMPLKEFDLLEILMTNAGRVVTREILFDRVWGYDYIGDSKTLDVHVKRLRSKVESDPSDPQRIVTIRGLGYKFAG